jgi:fibronectin type 3 domain-containing protein
VAAGANCAIAVIFTPSALGARTAALSITDNASGSPQTVALSGTGAHYVVLSWTASTTAGVVGYNAYRGTASSGPFSQLNSSSISGTTFTDAGVQAGQRYYYVVTAIASDDVTASANSNVASATVPSP